MTTTIGIHRPEISESEMPSPWALDGRVPASWQPETNCEDADKGDSRPPKTEFLFSCICPVSHHHDIDDIINVDLA